MKYLTSEEVAEKKGLSIGRIQQMYSDGCFDGANDSFYHGLMLGNQYQLRSNRETGLGRLYLQLMPLEKDLHGFIFEFKHTKDDLNALASLALAQIDEKKYDVELVSNGVKQMVKIGIAFWGKETAVK